MAGQLWQRVLRKPWWHCVLISTVLWLLSAAWLSSDSISPNDYNLTRLDLLDGILHLEEASLLTSACFLPFYLLLTFIIRTVHSVFRRDFPHHVERMRGGGDVAVNDCPDHYLGCCQLASRMLATFVPPNEYRVFSLLPVEEDVETAAAARAARAAGAEFLSPPPAPPPAPRGAAAAAAVPPQPV